MKINPGDEIECQTFLYTDWHQKDINRVTKEYAELEDDFVTGIKSITVEDVNNFIDDTIMPILRELPKVFKRLEEEQMDMIKNDIATITSSVINVAKSIEQFCVNIKHMDD